MSKALQPSVNEIRDQFRAGLRRAVTNPTINGYRPMAIQKKFHESKAKGKLFLGGNRAGKTVAGGANIVMYADKSHPNWKWGSQPARLRAIGSNWEDGVKKIIMPEIAKWIPPSLLSNGSWEDSYDVKARTLNLTNDSFIEFLTYEQDVQAHAGTSRHGVWFDEEPSEAIFNENMLRLVDTGGDWWLTMTPLIDMSWTYGRFIENKSPDIEVFQSSTLDNIYINPAELEILLVGMSDEEKLARQQGTYYNLTGGIYTASLSSDNFIDPIIGTPQWETYYRLWGHFGMLDHGFNNPTVFHLGCFDSEGRIVIYDEYYAVKKLVKENCKAILSLIKSRNLENKLEYIVCDPTTRNTDPITGTSVYSEYAEHGLFMVPGDNDVKKGINKVSQMLKENTLLITSNCKNLMKELPKYRWAKYSSSKTASKHNPQESPVKKDDHSLDAIRYGIMSRPELDAPLDESIGNVLGSPTALRQEYRIDELLAMPYKNWDNPDVWDETLGSDW